MILLLNREPLSGLSVFVLRGSVCEEAGRAIFTSDMEKCDKNLNKGRNFVIFMVDFLGKM